LRLKNGLVFRQGGHRVQKYVGTLSDVDVHLDGV